METINVFSYEIKLPDGRCFVVRASSHSEALKLIVQLFMNVLMP